MKELIKIEEKDGRRAVNARELHQFLQVGKDFSTWIKDRIDKYEFVENEDFVVTVSQICETVNGRYTTSEVFPKFGENSKGGRPQIEYALSLDMAKELSMVENNERGRMARRYFIECEKRLTEGKASTEDREIKNTKERQDIEAKVRAITTAVESMDKTLGLTKAAKLVMYRNNLEPLGIDVPDDMTGISLFHTADYLLKCFNINLDIKRFFNLLYGKGYSTEPIIVGSTGKGNILYSCDLAGKGRQYGMVYWVEFGSAQMPVPHFFDSKFKSLVANLTDNKN